MKLLAALICCVLLLGVPIAPQSAVAQRTTVGPEKVVRDFYAWYLHELNHDNWNPLKKKTVALKYLTPTLLANAPRLTRRMDADIFICAQDWSAEWEKKFTVAAPTIKADTAATLVTLPSGEMEQIKIKVTLIRTLAGWRINRLQCAD